MVNLEIFNNNALSDKSENFFELFVEDANNINDLRFLILRFCIALEKTADDILNKFKEKKENIIEVIDIQFKYFKLEHQKEKYQFPGKNRTFAIKISFLESICKFEDINTGFISLISLFKSLRNIIAHQFVSKEEFMKYLIGVKINIKLDFINTEIKDILKLKLEQNNFEDFFILISTSLMLDNLNNIV